jgi:competence protein ComEA
MLKTYKKIIIGIAIIAIIIAGILIYFLYNKNEKEEVVDDIIIEKEKITNDEKKEIKEYYYTDIKGAVINPGVYKIEVNSRVIDAINLTGGLNKDADTSVINLSKKVSDEMVIIIYTKAQIKKFQSSNSGVIVKFVDKNCECPDPGVNQACIVDTNSTANNNNPSTKISINTASITELQTLSGIGATKAQDIINYRNSNGPFTKIENIKNVSGIGDSTFAKIKDYITV